MQIKCLIIGDLQVNCYLLYNDNELVIIDSGEGEIDKILTEINILHKKYPLLKLTKIINTHYHFDHVTNVVELKKKTGAKILIHKAEENFIDFEVDKFLIEGDEIRVGNEILKVINTPGHTKGSICLIGNGFIFTGDTLFKDGRGRTDLAGGSESEMLKSLNYLNKIINSGLIVYPGHGESFKS